MFGLGGYRWYRGLGPVLKNAIDSEDKKKALDNIRLRYSMKDQDFAAVFLRTDFIHAMQLALHYGDVLAHDLDRDKGNAAREAAIRGFSMYEGKLNQADERDLGLMKKFLSRKSSILSQSKSIESVIEEFCSLSKNMNSRYHVNQFSLAAVVFDVDAVLRGAVDDLLNYIEAAYGK